MQKIRITMLGFVILLSSVFVSGCWNYREVDQFAIVAGVAVDKGTENQFLLTVEIIQISGGKDSKMTSKTMAAEGNTMLDAARNLISLTGKELYWSHSKVFIISKEIASEGLVKVIDWYTRHAETREDVDVLISERASAKEIFEGQVATEDIKSFVLDKMIKNQVDLSKAPITDLLLLDMDEQMKNVSAVIPTVDLKQIDGKMVPQIIGTAVIKNDKLVGFLDGEETKYLLFIRNEIKGGILTKKIKSKNNPTEVSLEIFKSKTKVTPVIDGEDIKIDLKIDITVAIDEIAGTENFIDEEGLKKLEQSAGNMVKENIEALIKKVQSEYDADIFDFGVKLHEDKAKVWNKVENNWEEIFKNLKVDIKPIVQIKNSALLSKTIEEGD
jgi:spore germination protein KC